MGRPACCLVSIVSINFTVTLLSAFKGNLLPAKPQTNRYGAGAALSARRQERYADEHPDLYGGAHTAAVKRSVVHSRNCMKPALPVQ